MERERFLRDKVSFVATMNNLRTMLSWIRKKAYTARFEETELKQIELAAEEALVNIIQHAYGGKEGKVELATFISGKTFEIEIRDEGNFFNPLLRRVSLDKKEGLGILLMCLYMNEVTYRRKGKLNILKLKKKLPH